jgi:hypothetical protein
MNRIVHAIIVIQAVVASQSAHAIFIPGEQYNFSGTASSYTVSGSFTVGAEQSPGSGTFGITNFTADSGAAGTDSFSLISGIVSNSTGMEFQFDLFPGYLPPGAVPTKNGPDSVKISGDILTYSARGNGEFTTLGGDAIPFLVEDRKTGASSLTRVSSPPTVP